MMKIDLVAANTKEYLAEVEKIYMEAFPAIERKPFSMLVDVQAKGNVEILMVIQSEDGQGINENTFYKGAGAAKGVLEDRLSDDTLKTTDNKADIVGEIILAQYADVVLLDYFAIGSSFRGHGIGAQVLGELRKRCKEKRLVLEIESTKVNADNLTQRLSRKAFYERCGMRTLDYSVIVMGVEMEVLTFGCEVGFEEYHAVYEQVFGAEIGARIQRLEKE